MDQVLVTGANGFLGSHICEALLEGGFAVKALVRRTSNLTNLSHLDVHLVYGDLNDIDSLSAAVAGVQAVVNNAGITKALDPASFDKVNAAGTANILNALEKRNPRIRRFIQISSAAASGPSSSSTPINEDHPPVPLTAYGRSKLAGERAVLAAKDRLPVTILRPSAIYGPRDREMLAFFRLVKFHVKPTFGKGECYINFTYVKDIAQAIVKTLTADIPSGRIYFVAEKRPYSYSEAAGIVAGVLKVRAFNIHVPVFVLRSAGWISEQIAHMIRRPAVFTAEKAIEISQKFWIIDTTKIEQELQFATSTSFETGVTETIAWYKNQGWL